MTRYFYHRHSDKEIAQTRHYQLNQIVWVLLPSTHTPTPYKFIDTNENWILFESKEDCQYFYNIEPNSFYYHIGVNNDRH